MKSLTEIRDENGEMLNQAYGSFEFSDIVSKDDYEKLKSFLSSAETRLLQGVVEKIEEMKKIVVPFDTKMKTVSEMWPNLRNEIYNSALSDLKTFILEGMKGK